jgi:sulfite exporter TauE/SafE
MDSFVLVVLNGLALGLASTLHCAGMCGAISCSLLLAQERGGVRNAQSAFALTQLGRITAYATAGAAVGLVGAPAIAWLDRDVAFRLLQWAGAASLIWVGLSTAGLLPSITVLDRGFAAVSGSVARAGVASPRRELVPFAAGLAWGMMPCAMVYAALFTAMLTGSGGGGALTMVAFGIGTLPGLIAASFGFRRLSTIVRGGPVRVAAGFAIALFGVATVFLAHPAAALFCLTGTPTEYVAPRVNRPVTRLDRGQTSIATRTLAFDSATEASGSRPNP